MKWLMARDISKCVIISYHMVHTSMTNSIVVVMDGSKNMRSVKGVVKWFNDAKGFGFIHTESHAGDIFVHYSQIMTDSFKTLVEGNIVEFDLVVGVKGANAYNVIKIADGNPLTVKDEDTCDHGDQDDGHCLDCGEDLTEYLVGRAEHYSDILNDR